MLADFVYRHLHVVCSADPLYNLPSDIDLKSVETAENAGWLMLVKLIAITERWTQL